MIAHPIMRDRLVIGFIMKEVEVKIHLANGFFNERQGLLSLEQDYNFFLANQSIYTSFSKLQFSIELKAQQGHLIDRIILGSEEIALDQVNTYMSFMILLITAMIVLEIIFIYSFVYSVVIHPVKQLIEILKGKLDLTQD